LIWCCELEVKNQKRMSLPKGTELPTNSNKDNTNTKIIIGVVIVVIIFVVALQMQFGGQYAALDERQEQLCEKYDVLSKRTTTLYKKLTDETRKAELYDRLVSMELYMQKNCR